MMCSQCQIGRAWDAKGRCRPCSIGNVNLGAPVPAGTAAQPAPPAPPPANLSLTPSPEAPAVPVPTPKPAPVACSQCWIGVAWDDEGRCRPCSDGGVRLAPATRRKELTAAPEEEAPPPRSALARARRWFGDRRGSSENDSRDDAAR
ncbi:hypothetical protein [Streptomyces bohaiensis]|uniref:Uncharacterized protein n=1 Tax=Streptomyces bohaiensis TaxID=1431344 RepID=A0ABX1CG47_9ACTN|nr:hypothetical protein [Streptomyces bohaiensis]NJQ16422.1 hypothetical protein [Streptomyces bohaiensis]